jgi:hypothetical protein
MTNRILWLSLVVFAGAVPAAAAADPGQGPPGPPKEAFEACAGKAAGAACTVVLRDEQAFGTCRRGPDAGEPLACAPASLPDPPAR